MHVAEGITLNNENWEFVNRKAIAPLSYIEDQAAKVILHRRKIKLLEEKKEELYEQKTNQIKVFPYAPITQN